MIYKMPAAIMLSACLFAGCSNARQGVGTSEGPAPASATTPVPTVTIGTGSRIGGAGVISTPPPAAVAYRTNGDYADNVPVTVDVAGELLSYPAPTDVRNAEPLPLADGYLLDRRGINASSVFTRYTYAEYSSLTTTPTTDSLKAAIIRGSRVTEIVTLPMTQAEAEADTAAVNAYLREL